MTDETTTMTPAERMAKARAARAAKKDAAPSESAGPTTTVPVGLALSEDAVLERAEAQARARSAAETAVDTSGDKTNNTRVAEKLAAEADMKLRAARQRAQAGLAPPAKNVQVRITKAGDGKVSMGQHVAGIGEAYFEKNETTNLPIDNAKALEDRGYVEILDEDVD